MTDKYPDDTLDPNELLSTIKGRGRKGLTVKQLANQLAAERKIDRSEARRLLRPALKVACCGRKAGMRK
jgi:hypothetical protein